MSEPTIRDYVQHKWPCALLGDGASWAVVPKDSVCTEAALPAVPASTGQPNK